MSMILKAKHVDICRMVSSGRWLQRRPSRLIANPVWCLLIKEYQISPPLSVQNLFGSAPASKRMQMDSKLLSTIAYSRGVRPRLSSVLTCRLRSSFWSRISIRSGSQTARWRAVWPRGFVSVRETSGDESNSFSPSSEPFKIAVWIAGMS